MTKILTQREWREIKPLVQSEDRNITEIAKTYGVSRTAIYSYAWNRKWLVKEKEKKKEEAKRNVKVIPKKKFLERLWKKITH